MQGTPPRHGTPARLATVTAAQSPVGGPSPQDVWLADAVASRLEARLNRIESQLRMLVQQGNVGAADCSHPLWDVRPADDSHGMFRREAAKLDQAARAPTQSLASQGADHSYTLLDKVKSKSEATESELCYADNDTDSSEDVKEPTIYDKLNDCMGRFMKLKEPERKGKCAEFVMSENFARASFLVIALNTVCIWYNTNEMSANRNFVVSPYAHIVEVNFLAFYSMELALRLYVHREFFFVNDSWAWNAFDFVIVLAGIVDICLNTFYPKYGDVGSNFLPICRILRITKILRIFKAFRFLKELKLMASCVLGSMVSLVWSSLFLLFFLMVSALFMVQSTTHYRIDNPDCDKDVCEDLELRFGKVRYAMLSLFQSTTGGVDWAEYFELVSKSNVVSSIFFLGYIIFFNFAFFNIITSMFVEKAMIFARPDEEHVLKERQMEEAAAEKQLNELLHEVDDDESGDISLQELKLAMKQPTVLHKFEMLGVTVRDVQMFFSTLTSISQKDELSIDEFTRGCLRMRGQASALDMQTVHFQVSELSKAVNHLRHMMCSLKQLRPL